MIGCSTITSWSLIWNAANTLGWPYDAIVKLLLLTGARRGEVVGMRWAEVDLEKNLWSLPADRVKNKRPHALPLPSLCDRHFAGAAAH